MSVYRSVKLLHPQKLTAGYPKMMVWKILSPYQKSDHFWYQFVKFLECKTVISLFFGPEKWFDVWDRWEESNGGSALWTLAVACEEWRVGVE